MANKFKKIPFSNISPKSNIGSKDIIDATRPRVMECSFSQSLCKIVKGADISFETALA
jgi:hypothetical protein